MLRKVLKKLIIKYANDLRFIAFTCITINNAAVILLFKRNATTVCNFFPKS